MATRTRTTVFQNYRNEKRSFSRQGGFRSANLKQGLLSTEMEDLEAGKKKGVTPPPEWMSLVDNIQYEISRIKTKMEELAESHKNHLLPTFNVSDKIDDEQTIEILTNQITSMFFQGQSKVKQLGNLTISEQEESVRRNMQSSLALQLQDLSVGFKKSQKDYLSRLRGRNQMGKGITITENEEDEMFDVAFTPNQRAQLSSNSQAIDQRHKDIVQIAKSINELNQIFKDLNVLIIEQGTILDRIDHNIEITKHNVQDGIVALRGANKSSKSYGKCLCAFLLCLIVLVMGIVVAVKAFAF